MPPTLEDEDDTIIVKGEDWQSSSPDSTSPAIDPLVANIMAQINNCSSPLESPSTMPDPQSSATHISYPPDAEQTESADPSPKRRVVQGTMEERLQSMPKLREMPWRPGTELPLVETGGESRRKQIRFGTLLATRGNVVSEPCKTCASGRGKFSVCVALEGFFKGACASCQLSGRPNRCTIKLQDEPKAEPDPSELTITITPEQGEHYSNGRQASSSSFISQIQPPKGTQSQFQIQTPGQPRRKSNNYSDNSMENPTAKRRRTDGPQWDKSLAASQLQQAKEPPGPTWAAVNRPEPTAPTSNGTETNGKVPHNSSGYGKREDTAAMEDGSVPLIDTFPKSKQRQLYGIVSGLQGGIEHLQKELDMLKKALGIDDGD